MVETDWTCRTCGSRVSRDSSTCPSCGVRGLVHDAELTFSHHLQPAAPVRPATTTARRQERVFAELRLWEKAIYCGLRAVQVAAFAAFWLLPAGLDFAVGLGVALVAELAAAALVRSRSE